ncbi:response regulator transcription factor [Granulicella sp. S156]|uniref:response regulator transcription factor n=1 Tax=Granulicella sp. S156 TaxID=1747224 RepID=UPI00131AA1F3|nr:LuxR C-terminal-related transcriptional regulator [Granulicella sp. S156]
MRVLLFACNASDAQKALKYGDRMEIAFLPSYDMEEIRREIARFKPKLVTCRADVFLSVSSTRPPGVSVGDQASDATIPGGIATTFVTPREKKLLAMLAKGKTNGEIASTLQVSARTVKRTLSGLFERLRAANRTELASRAAQLRLLNNDR